MMESRERVSQLLKLLNEGIFEKEHVMGLAFLAIAAGESIFLLGPPGTAKSMIARRLKQIFRSGSAFEYLMSRFSTPDEIFGPVSISALKDESRYIRLTEGYLPSADVVFLDEIWKAGPSIQNALLTVLNEKIYLNGKEELHLPLKLIIAASNELPAEGENLGALWDRFLLRCLVGGVTDRQLFNLMVSSSGHITTDIPVDLRLTEAELSLWAESIDKVEIPAFAFSFIHFFRSGISEYNVHADEKDGQRFYISDRRWKKIVHLWRTSAFLNGRSALALSDLLLLRECVWDVPQQLTVLSALLSDAFEATCEELLGYALLVDRLAAVKELKRQQTVSVNFKVVKAFFYQIQSMVAGHTVLIYVSEYEELDRQRPTYFILTYDKRKTGAQILRKYVEGRYPGALPKDLLRVVRTATGLQVNGRSYDLLQEKAEEGKELPSENTCSDDAALSVTLVERMQTELQDMRSRLAEWEQREREYADSHLFIDNKEREILELVFRRLHEKTDVLQVDTAELRHAVGK